jgi:hypothetical protein
LEHGERLSLDDGEKFARVAKEVIIESLSIWNDPKGNPYLTKVFQPKRTMR